jgi:hypothetical protein
MTQTSNTSIEIFGKLPDDLQRCIFEYIPDVPTYVQLIPRTIRLTNANAFKREELMKLDNVTLDRMIESFTNTKIRTKKSDRVDAIIDQIEDARKMAQKYDTSKFETLREKNENYPSGTCVTNQLLFISRRFYDMRYSLTTKYYWISRKDVLKRVRKEEKNQKQIK